MVYTIKQKFQPNSDSVLSLVPDAIKGGSTLFGVVIKRALGGAIAPAMVARR